MIAYSPVPLRLGQTIIPLLSPLPVMPPAVLSPSEAPAEPHDKKALLTLVGISLLALGITVGGTWVGVRTGIKEKGFLSLTGWTVGIMSGIGVLSNMGTLILAGAKLAKSDVAA